MAGKNDSYGRALDWCGGAALAGLIAQHLWIDWRSAGSSLSLALLGALCLALAGAVAVAAWREKRALVTFLVSVPFTVTVVGALTALTILGTLVLQSIAPERFEQTYGAFATPLRFLFLEDLFHSFWFQAEIGLLMVSLTLIALRRWPWTWPRVGYAMAHLGIVIGLLGAAYGSLTGVKGRIDTEVGRATDRILGSDWRTGRRVPHKLPFEVRLDDFRIDEYEPVYRLYLFEHVAGNADPNAFKPVLALDPEKQVGQPVDVGRGVRVRLDAYDPQGPAPQKTASAPHVLSFDGREYPVEPGKTYPDLGGYHVAVGAHFPHFTYDLESKQAANASNEPKNPAMKVTLRKGGPEGEVAHDGWLFANMPGFSMNHGKGADGQAAWTPVYLFGGAKAPAGPTLAVAVTEGGATRRHTLELTEGKHLFSAAGGDLVGVFRVRDNEAKNYYSTLSILKNDQVVATKQIYVNEPLFHEGWAFYQANYDPQNLLYSGIEAVRDPGLPLVYLGLTLMMLGVFQIFYLRTLRRKRQVAE